VKYDYFINIQTNPLAPPEIQSKAVCFFKKKKPTATSHGLFKYPYRFKLLYRENLVIMAVLYNIQALF
jgi:hypothetical protein